MRHWTRTVIIFAALGVALIPWTAPTSAAATAIPPLPFDKPVPLGDVVRADLDIVASASGLPVEQLTEMAKDSAFQVDKYGKVLATDKAIPPPSSSAAEPADAPAAPPGVDVFALHSRPNSTRTIYLDFNGHTARDTGWNDIAPELVAPPYDTDGQPATFSADERNVIYQAFLATAEDFRPFDVDVTTEEPTADEINRTDDADQVYGTRAVITGTDVTQCNCGGQAYLGVFNTTSRHDMWQPAWAYAQNWQSGKSISEIVSHEVGHNFGLSHDGVQGQYEYYSGHTNWAPIMGSAYYEPVTQWSKGEYQNPSNTEDDFAVMARFGGTLLTDDHGNDPASATTITPGQQIAGIITTDSDVDAFAFDHSGGKVTIAAAPASYAPDLDLKMVVRNSSGAVVATVDPPVNSVNTDLATGLDATYTATLPAGRYTVQLEGTGYGDPGTNGYTGYASVGAYTLTVTRG